MPKVKSIKDPKPKQTCRRCKRKNVALADGCFLEKPDEQGRRVFVCEDCEPSIAPRD